MLVPQYWIQNIGSQDPCLREILASLDEDGTEELGMYLAVDVVLDADGNAIEQPLLLLLLQFLELILTPMNEVCHTVHLPIHLQSLSRTEKSSKTEEGMEGDTTY